MNWLMRLAGAVVEGQVLTLDPTTDLVFLNADNPINQQQIRFYEQQLEAGKQIEPVNVVYIMVTASILQELGCSDLIPMGRKAKNRDWVFVVTNGHHRAMASRNKGMPFQAKVIRVM